MVKFGGHSWWEVEPLPFAPTYHRNLRLHCSKNTQPGRCHQGLMVIGVPLRTIA